MNKSKWLVAVMLMTVVLIFVGCTSPVEPTEEALVTSEEVVPSEDNAEEKPTVAAEEAVVQPVVAEETMATVEEAAMTETPAVTDEEVVLGMISPDAVLAKDEIAPDFALKNLDGEVVQLSDYRGKLVLLNFWTTW